MIYPNIFLMSYSYFETCRIFYVADFLGPHKWKSPKNRFFQNGLKYLLEGLEYRFLVQNDSKTLQEPISGHISSFQPISAILQTFEFLAKIDFFAILWIFDFSQYGRPFGRKWSKMWFLAGNSLFGSTKHFYISYMIFHDDYIII